MSGRHSTRFKPLLGAAFLLSCLLSHDVAFAQTGSATALDASLQAPPRALGPPPRLAALDTAPPVVSQAAEQRVALVIGNSHYQNVTSLTNPDNDARAMAQFLNSAGFEVTQATNLTQTDMIKVVQDFSARVAARGANAVAMIYYAGHGVQLAGENYLIPVDAKISQPSDLTENSLRLVDVMATLDAIQSRMRIVVLDACRNNPFPTINDANRGLAIVDAPNGSIVGYSTAPGEEALDGSGSGNHSPYTDAFLRLAREPNMPIEQLFKRVRLQVNQATDGHQTPWESSSLTSDFTFFGDTTVASLRPPEHGPVVQMASNLPGRSVRQAYDYVLSEGSPQHYREFIEMFPRDPLADRIRALLTDVVQAAAWHQAVLANLPSAYQTFSETYADSPYAPIALRLRTQPRPIPIMQPTRLMVPPQPIHTVARPIATLPVNTVVRPGPVAPQTHGKGAPNRIVNAGPQRPFQPVHRAPVMARPINNSRTSFARGPSNLRMNSGPRFAQSGGGFRMGGGGMGHGMGGGGMHFHR